MSRVFKFLFIGVTAVTVAYTPPAMAAPTITLVGKDLQAITTAGKSNNDNVGYTIAFLDALFHVNNVAYIGTLDGPGDNAGSLPAGQSITGSISGSTASFTSSKYLVLAFDVKASTHNALYTVVPGILYGTASSSGIVNHGGQLPNISHVDFFGVPVVPVKGVPEPATWAMMLLGFGGIGAGLRRRSKNSSLQVA